MKDELSLDRDTGYIEDWAEIIYLYLKTAGVVGSMGYVEL